MNNEITCFVDMFATEQIVELPDSERYKVSREELPQFLVKMCDSLGLYKIHLYGVKDYVFALAVEIEDTNLRMFHNVGQQIEIGVN